MIPRRRKTVNARGDDPVPAYPPGIRLPNGLDARALDIRGIPDARLIVSTHPGTREVTLRIRVVE